MLQRTRRACLLLACTVAVAGAVQSTDYTLYKNTDITPCVSPCVRVGNCGYNYNVTCDPNVIAQLCDQTCGCVAFNNNGWLKGCGNASCGVTFQSESGVDTYVKDNGIPPSSPDVPVPAIDDVHYPLEEVAEAAAAGAAAAAQQLSTNPAECWAVLQQPGGTQTSNVTCGSSAFGFVLQSVVQSLRGAPAGTGAVAVLERTFERWGYIAYVSQSAGEVARLRKGTGMVTSLVMPNFNAIVEADCLYYTKVSTNATDYLRGRVLDDSDGQPTFLAAAKYMPPQRDYAHIGAVTPYQKYSVAPDGRIKLADGAIWTTDNLANETGPGTLIWDPRSHLPAGCWPETNFTYSKSALVGRHLRVVAVTSYSPSTGNGFEQVAVAPAADVSGNALVRLQGWMANANVSAPQYYNVSAKGAIVPLPSSSFYAMLYSEQLLWNQTLTNAASPATPGAVYSLPGHEGARQIDMTWGGMVSSLSLFVGLIPNYGDGADYWTPGGDNGGNLPFQTVSLNSALQAAGLMNTSADLLAFYFDKYIVNGTYSTGTWELSCPEGYADGRSDHGILMSLLVRTARLMLASNGLPQPQAGQWVSARMATLGNMSQWALAVRQNATAHGAGAGDPTHGLFYGAPEHDTCRDQGYYYHNNVWLLRGMIDASRLISDICATYCPTLMPLAAALSAEAAAYRTDLLTSLNLTVTRDSVTGAVTFIPPVASLAFAPFNSMIESTLSSYSNFRYYSELLGADILPADMAVGLMDFRESHTGTVSGITRWTDHLDDMPSVHYLSSALWYDRLPSFWILHYGHMANYMGRGTWTATEQIPIGPDANGFYRDYLWDYLEGGIDECVPSIMLPALATQMQLVLERFDASSVWLGMGAPNRWANTTGPGYGVANANTIFGLFSFHASSQSVGTNLESVSFSLFYQPTASPGVSQTPTIVVRLRSFDPTLAIKQGTVDVKGAGLVSVDTAASTVTLQLSPGSPSYPITIQAVFD